MYVLTINGKKTGEPLSLREAADKYQSLKHAITNIGYEVIPNDSDQCNVDATIAKTHWVYTPEGCRCLVGTDQERAGKISVGVAINPMGATACPAEWILKGWVTEATNDQHQRYKKWLGSIWDIKHDIGD